MTNALVSFAFQFGCFLPVLCICLWFNGRPNINFLLMGMAVMFLDVMAATLTRKIPGFHFEGQQWNWFGKGAEIALALVLLVMLPKLLGENWLSRSPVLVSKQWAFAILGFLVLGGIFIGFMNPPENFQLQTFLFQLLMPSISEELIYRCLLFSLFLSAFNGSLAIPALLVTVWFGIIHAVGWNSGGFQFDVISFLVTFLVGSLLILLRLASDSLILPIAGHSLYNLCIQLIALRRI